MTQELIVNNVKSNEVTITSLEIAEITGKEHKNVMADIRNTLEKVVNGGVLKFQHTYEHPQNRQTYILYRLPKREALILVSGYSVELRAKIIDRLEYLENKLRANIPQNYIEALEALIVKEKERIALIEQVEKQKPLVEFAENIAVSANSIPVGDFAKILCNNENIRIGAKGLFSWLRSKGYLQYNNMPYQKYIDCGLFKVKEGKYVTPQGIKSYTQTLITGKGQIYFSNKIIKEKQNDTKRV